MKKILIGTFGFTLTLGVIAIAMNLTFGIQFGFITYSEKYKMYIFDMNIYLSALRNSLSQLSGIQYLTFPETPVLNWSDPIQAIKSIAKVLVQAVNFVIVALNIILAIFKIVIHIILIVITILGINTESWYTSDILYQIFRFTIDYIPTNW